MCAQKRLFLTGASGLLGRAVHKKFVQEGWNVKGVAFSRTSGDLIKLDLNDFNAVRNELLEYKPNIIIHCAAQRYPEKVEADMEAALSLNVRVTENLSACAGEISSPILYISTDYVFDGKNPPYKTSDEPNPLNFYGKTKLDGEKACLTANSGNLVLRIPVLYGPVEKLSESAVTVLLESLLNTSKQIQVSDYEKRRPSHVDDIAYICFQLATKKAQDDSICGIFHWCGAEVLTKYNMIQIMAEVFNLPHSHITPGGAPTDTVQTPRPYDTTLDTGRLTDMNINCHTSFKEGIYQVLKPWIKV